MITIPDEIKRLYLEHGVKKNIRISFPSGSYADICNDKIVLNSVKFTESICSQNKFKLGLAEASVFRCEVVDVDNIKGEEIYVYNEIFCSSSVPGAVFKSDLNHYVYQIPYGIFYVNSATKQADMSHRQIEAYSLMAYENWGIVSKIEKHKTGIDGSVLNSNTNYDFDVVKTMLSNMRTSDTINYFQTDRGTYTNEGGDGRGRTLFTVVSQISELEEYVINFNVQYMYTLLQGAGDAEKLIYVNRNEAYDGEIEEAYEDYRKICRNYNINNPVSKQEIMDVLNYGYIELKETVLYPESGWRSEKYASEGYYRTALDGYIKMIYANFSFPESTYDNYTNCICVPFKTKIMLFRRYINSGNEGSLIVNSERQFRSINTHFLNIEDLPTIMGTVARSAFTHNGATYYALTDTSYMTKEVEDATIELLGGIGNIKRDGRFEIISPKIMSGLYPGNSLYPSATLYPDGTQGYTTPATYQSAWYDDLLSKPYGRVCATYKDTNNIEQFDEVILHSDYNNGNYQDYDISNNAVIQKYQYSHNTIMTILNFVADAVRSVQYMPSEVTAVGQPWLEAGDTIGIETISGEVLKTIILSRELSGEQILTDFYDSY